MTKRKKKFVAGIAAVSAIAIAATIGLTYQASANDNEKSMKDEKLEQKEQMYQALENSDYGNFIEIAEKKFKLDDISEDDFNKLVEAHNLAKEGKFTEARAIKDELGLMGPKGKMIDGENREAIYQALENNDYNAWKEVVGDRPITESINEDNFHVLVEIHNLKKDGKFSEAKELAEENGIDRGFGKMGKHKGCKCSE